MGVPDKYSKWVRAWYFFCLALDVSILAVLFWRVVLIPENHWGFDNTCFPWMLVPQLLCLAGLRWIGNERSRCNSVAALLCALTLLASWLCVELNLLLPYELWIRRGMPDAFG